jgi:CBS domain-containing protein
MRVSQLMNTRVHTCHASDSLDLAAQRMWSNDCGCLPVLEPDGSGQVIGIITDRDICMSAMFQGKPLASLSVSEAMARNVRTCRQSDTTGSAETVMREARIRRLPVVNDDGALVGVLSLADLAREAAREQCAPHKHLTGDEIGITLAAICAPGN